MLGGGISSTLLAIAILKKKPEIKILILEKGKEFAQKIGESTSDLGAICLRTFGIDHLLRDQVPKAGLRFLFNEKNSPGQSDQIEFASPSFRSRYTGFQLNRKIFDEQLLKEAESLGATVLRPVDLKEAVFEPFCIKLKLNFNSDDFSLTSRWFLDATGRARYIQHKLNWKSADIPLMTGSVAAHFRNLNSEKNWSIEEDDYWKNNSIGKGSDATLHFMRPHRWWWLIRIDNQITSIGVVFDKNKIRFEDAEIFFNTEIANDVQLNLITKGAERGEIICFDQIAYQSQKICDEGIVLLGDCAATIDPLQSPGIELICQQTIYLKDLLIDDVVTKKYKPKRWKRFERIFQKSFTDRIKIYEAGYNYFESYDLTKNWLRAGAFGYFGITVFMAVLFPSRLKKPFTLNFFSRMGFNFLKWRLDRIAKRRRAQNRVSVFKNNLTAYTGICYPKGLRFYTVPFRLFGRWFADYLKLECREIPYWFKSAKKLKPDSD